MAEIVKPNTLNTIWADIGDKIKPSDSKIQQGWEVEIPPHQVENWAANRRDMAIAHINQRGIAQWDEYTSYIGGKSYVQGSDGNVYRALVDNIGKNPLTENEYWYAAFVSEDDVDSLKLFNGYIVISNDVSVSANNRYYALGNLTITLPSSASLGDAVTLNKNPSSEVVLEVDGGGSIRTLEGLYDEVLYDIIDQIYIVWNGNRWQTS